MTDRRLRYLVYTLFLASGVSGLMYQVVWVRMLNRLMGVTVYATSTVLAAFMAGLALGSFLLGRYVDRRTDALRVYAVLELCVGVAALAVPFAFALAFPLYRGVYNAIGEGSIIAGIVRVAYCFLLLLVPTTMMGGTLPVLTAFLVKRQNLFGKSFSLLYGLNTFGAVAGVLVSGFVTIGLFGEWATIGIAVAINLLVALVAWRAAAGAAGGQAVPGPAVGSVAAEAVLSRYPDTVRRLVLVTFALSGLTALAYEVIWTRQLILFLRTSIYAFAGMLGIFLTGIALGSILMNRVVDRLKSPLLIFGLLELVVGVLSVFNLYLFAVFDSNVVRRVLGLSSVVYATVAIVLPLTFVFGLIFPVAAVCYAKDAKRTGASVGTLYGSNTLGSILGALIAGFLLLPQVGSTRAVMILAAMNVGLGLLLTVLEPGRGLRVKLAVAAIAPVVLLLVFGFKGRDPFRATIENRISERRGTTWIPASNAALPKSEEIYFHKEGVEGTVTAFAVNQFKQLWINGVGMVFLNSETKLMAHLPILLADDPKEFLAIALGMGTAARSASRHPSLSVTVVDLVPETFQTFRYYHADAEQILARSDFRTVTNDGRNFLLLSSKRFDVISVDPAPPIYSAGTVNLYTKNFFELARSRLTPGGVFCLWFPGGTKREVQSLLRTFHSVYPHATIWAGPHGWGWYLIGKQTAIDLHQVRRRAEEVLSNPVIRADILEFDSVAVRPDEVMGLLLWQGKQLDSITAGGVLITDNFPFTEFPLWRYLFQDRLMWHPRSTWRTYVGASGDATGAPYPGGSR